MSERLKTVPLWNHSLSLSAIPFSRLPWLMLFLPSGPSQEIPWSSVLRNTEPWVCPCHLPLQMALSSESPSSLIFIPLPTAIHLSDGFAADLPYFLTSHNFNSIIYLASHLCCSPGLWLLLFTLVLLFMAFVFLSEDVWTNLELSSYCYSGIWRSHTFEIWNAWWRLFSRNPSIYKWVTQRQEPICPELNRTKLKTVALPTSHCEATKAPSRMGIHCIRGRNPQSQSLGVSIPTFRTRSL